MVRDDEGRREVTVDGGLFAWCKDVGLRIGTADASDLGMPMGRWPATIEVVGRTRTVEFTCSRVEYDRDGDVRWCAYRSCLLPTVELKVFND
jgi:hypothetical protein